MAHSSHMTYSLILKKEQQQWLTCQTPGTVKHIFIEYRAFVLNWKRFFNVDSMSDWFEKVNMDDDLSFWRETGLYQRIWFEHSVYMLFGSIPEFWS